MVNKDEYYNNPVLSLVIPNVADSAAALNAQRTSALYGSTPVTSELPLLPKERHAINGCRD